MEATNGINKGQFYIGQKVTIDNFDRLIMGPGNDETTVYEIESILFDDQRRQYMATLDKVDLIYCWRLLPVDETERNEIMQIWGPAKEYYKEAYKKLANE